MLAIETGNASLKGVLPRDYARPALNKVMLGELIDLVSGRQQPAPFRPGKPMRLTDAHGRELSVTIVDILGRSALIEYQPYKP